MIGGNLAATGMREENPGGIGRTVDKVATLVTGRTSRQGPPAVLRGTGRTRASRPGPSDAWWRCMTTTRVTYRQTWTPT